MSDIHQPGPEDDELEPEVTAEQIAQALNLAATLRSSFNASQYAADLQRQLNQFALPAVSGIQPALDIARKALASTQAVQSAAAEVQRVQAMVVAQWDGFFTAFESFRKAAWPSNWAGITKLDIGTVVTVCLDEGIPLMWVPRSETVQLLLEAPDASARRRIIGQRHRGILTDCSTVFESVAHPSLRALRDYAFEAVEAIASGYPAAAQSLAGNLLETLITVHIDEDMHDLLKRRKEHKDSRFDLDDFQFRTGLALAPVWSAYTHYYANRGDVIPREFARNATAHSVSRRQFSRVNAVIAVMVVSSLLRLINGPER